MENLWINRSRLRYFCQTFFTFYMHLIEFFIKKSLAIEGQNTKNKLPISSWYIIKISIRILSEATWKGNNVTLLRNTTTDQSLASPIRETSIRRLGDERGMGVVSQTSYRYRSDITHRPKLAIMRLLRRWKTCAHISYNVWLICCRYLTECCRKINAQLKYIYYISAEMSVRSLKYVCEYLIASIVLITIMICQTSGRWFSDAFRRMSVRRLADMKSTGHP